MNRSFFVRSALEVAPDLVGRLLVHETSKGIISGRIVETEAYVGEEDMACHARFGRTKRSEVLYGEPGRAYIYLNYGMYWMLNVVCAPVDVPEAVLIRAIEPVEGVDLMLQNRHRGTAFHRVKPRFTDRYLERNLTNGPARLCLALGVDGALNRDDLVSGKLRIEDGESAAPADLAVSKRIGVEYAGVWAQKPWRFYEQGNRWVSR